MTSMMSSEIARRFTLEALHMCSTMNTMCNGIIEVF